MKGLPRIVNLFCVSLLFQVGTSASAFAQVAQDATQASNPVPEKVLYEMYFRRAAFFEDLADRSDQGDLSRLKMRAKIMEELGIDEGQRDILLQISRQALEEAAILDAQAREIISRERARYPGGEIKDANQVPQIPAELQSLQQARDAVFMNAKSRLLNRLGSAVFDRVHLRIRSIILSNARGIKPE